MRQIHLVIGNMPEVLLQVVALAVRSQPDMVLVQEARGNIEVLQAVHDAVDLVVLGADQVLPCPGICSHLLSEFPHLKILVISTSGAEARSYWLGLRQRKVSAATADTLIRELRRLYSIDAME